MVVARMHKKGGGDSTRRGGVVEGGSVGRVLEMASKVESHGEAQSARCVWGGRNVCGSESAMGESEMPV